LNVAAERVEHIAPIVHPLSRRVGQWHCTQPPEENGDIRNVIAPAAAADAAHIDRPRHVVERAVELFKRPRVPDVGDGQVVRAHVIQVLRGRELPENLDDRRIPARHVARQVFEHCRGALAPAESDGIGDFRARTAYSRGQSM
jgi:3'-phosphoadenosine 5'-phosphosulfate sulfotransferase (PAPS reductase)/FAD synthetase